MCWISDLIENKYSLAELSEMLRNFNEDVIGHSEAIHRLAYAIETRNRNDAEKEKN